MEPIRILLVSSFVLLREGMCALLSAYPHWQVVGKASEWDAVREQASRTQPHVIIMDVPQANTAFETLVHGLKEAPQTPAIIVLTRQEDEATLLRILKSGVQACLSERSSPGDLVTAIEAVVMGASFLCPAASRALLQDYRRRAKRALHDSTP